MHTRGIPLADDADLEALAGATPGMVGADLASLANEAALLAATRGHEAVQMRDFDDALAKTLLGTERRLVMTQHDRERTAHHEAGHALVGMLSPHADPVRRISIIPRGTALGVTYAAPDADRYSYTREELLTKIRVALGGRAAEQLVYGEVTTGAESDIEQLTVIARQMVGRWGMSDAVGAVAVIPSDSRAMMLPGVAEASPESQRLVDAEVRRIVDQAQREATALLAEHRDQLESLTSALLEAETLDEAQAYAAAGLDRRPPAATAAEAPERPRGPGDERRRARRLRPRGRPGARRADRRRARPPLALHEEREFEDGEHKARPLETVRGRDVYVIQTLHGDADQSANDKLCRLLFFIGGAQGRRRGKRHGRRALPVLCAQGPPHQAERSGHHPIRRRLFEASAPMPSSRWTCTIQLRSRTPSAAAPSTSRPRPVRRTSPALGGQDLCVVSPDTGGAKRADALRERWKRRSAPVGEGVRGEARSAGVVSGDLFVGDVAGRCALIIDDLISTGGTLVRAARRCREAGAPASWRGDAWLFAPGAAEVLGDPAIEGSSSPTACRPSGWARGGAVTVLAVGAAPRRGDRAASRRGAPRRAQRAARLGQSGDVAWSRASADVGRGPARPSARSGVRLARSARWRAWRAESRA